MSSPEQNWWARISAEPGGERVLPDYSGGSILNLMRSVADVCGGPSLPWPPLRGLDVQRLARRRNLVLLVIDGLGLAYLAGRAEGFLRRHLAGHATSVFPSTTASAVTTFLTGLPPSRHALTGWHIYFSECDRILASLPLTARGGQLAPEDREGLPARLFAHGSIFTGMRREAWACAPAEIADSPFNRHHTAGARRLAYAGFPQMLEAIGDVVGSAGAPRYVYAYYSELDALAHTYGIAGKPVGELFAQIDAALGRFADSLRGTDTALIVTADHGFVDSPPQRLIELDAHPQMAALLARPLCGERRVAYCYVRPGEGEALERYVRRHLWRQAEIARSAELVARGWFGPGEPHPRLAERIGDYAIVMKGDWTLADALPGEKRHRMLGVHGGLSRSEMEVPVVLAEL